MDSLKDMVLLKGKFVHAGIISPSRAARFDVPYIPTPHEVVEEMLRLAGVGGEDILYDLGCGDGRIVISAARQYGACGVGVDINPRRIMESCRNAHKARVRDKVRFVRKSIFDADTSKATIVTLYLLSSVNVKLRPKLLRELKPGTRIVSHEFNMGDWPPDQALEVEGHPVYSWVVPANVRGEWEWTMQDSGGAHTICTLRLSQRFQTVAGRLRTGGVEMPLTDAMLKGDMLRFTVRQGTSGLKRPIRFRGRVDGDFIRGVMVSDNRVHARVGWTAGRAQSAPGPIDGS